MITRIFITIAWIGLIFGVLWTSNFRKMPEQEEKTIHLYAWVEMFPVQVLNNFEKETGIKVKRHFFSSNEELLVTLKANKGKGYDVFIPSDYAVKMLIDENYLKPIDHKRLNFLDTINPSLKGLDYDPAWAYSLPYQWEIFGFGIDGDYFKEHGLVPSWDLVFNSKHENLKLAMVNDPIEAVNFAAHHLFGASPKLEERDIQSVHKILEDQKKRVESYAGLRADYLLATKNCHMALCLGSYIFRSEKHYPHLKFVVPEKWTFASVENVCIAKSTNKDDLIYQFINFIYRPENLARDCNAGYALPATTNTTPYLNVPPQFLDFVENSTQFEGKLYFMYHLIPEKTIRQMWVDIKS